MWAIEFEQNFIGLIGTQPGLGYWSCPETWGQGLMTEAAQAIVTHYFASSDSIELSSSYFEGNISSARILKKLGFVEIGQGMEHCLAQNKEIKSHQMVLRRRG